MPTRIGISTPWTLAMEVPSWCEQAARELSCERLPGPGKRTLRARAGLRRRIVRLTGFVYSAAHFCLMEESRVSTASLPLRSTSWVRAKYFLFAFISVMLAYVLWHNERFLIDARDPIWRHYEPFKGGLLPPGLAGACRS